VDDRLGEVSISTQPAFAFVDLSRRHDLTSIVVVTRGPARRPEAADQLVTASVMTWNPKDSPRGEVDFAEVRAALAALPRRFLDLQALAVDEGSEAGSILPWAHTQPGLTLVTRGFVGSPESNMQIWSALAARLHAGTLSIPRHERLLDELRNLKQESFTFGSRWRVVDSARKFHRDVSLALAGAVWAAQGAGRRCTVEWCHDPECSGLHLLNADTDPDPDRERDALLAAGELPSGGRRERPKVDAVIDEGIKRVGSWFPED
jgi:hypothetical protein